MNRPSCISAETWFAMYGKVGTFLGYDDDQSKWTTQQEAVVEKVIQAGVEQFLNPRVTAEEVRARWKGALLRAKEAAG